MQERVRGRSLMMGRTPWEECAKSFLSIDHEIACKRAGGSAVSGGWVGGDEIERTRDFMTF